MSPCVGRTTTTRIAVGILCGSRFSTHSGRRLCEGGGRNYTNAMAKRWRYRQTLRWESSSEFISLTLFSKLKCRKYLKKKKTERQAAKPRVIRRTAFKPVTTPKLFFLL